MYRKPPIRTWAVFVLVVAMAATCSAGSQAQEEGGSTEGRPVRFVSEHVRVSIDTGHTEITGSYCFDRGTGRSPFALLYPFARGFTLAKPEVLELALATDDGPFRTTWALEDSAGLHLALPFNSADSCRLRVHYRQRLSDRRADYLLTTTRAWGQPLALAVLEVSWPDSLAKPSFSLPLEVAGRGGGMTLYRLRASAFLPETDIVVTW